MWERELFTLKRVYQLKFFSTQAKPVSYLYPSASRQHWLSSASGSFRHLVRLERALGKPSAASPNLIIIRKNK